VRRSDFAVGSSEGAASRRPYEGKGNSRSLVRPGGLGMTTVGLFSTNCKAAGLCGLEFGFTSLHLNLDSTLAHFSAKANSTAGGVRSGEKRLESAGWGSVDSSICMT
jgi:hypothetical protein